MPWEKKMGEEKTILVVDDDPNILAAFQEFLTKEGYRMIQTDNALDAIDQIRGKRIHLLITDIRLSGMSGVAFLLQVKKLAPDLPVIVMSSYTDLISEQDLRRFGADYFFPKPLELAKMRETISGLL